MAIWLQNLVVGLAVIGCLIVVGRQLVSTLRGRKSKMGACCAKGCDAGAAGAARPQAAGKRVVFLPVEMLRKR